MLEIAAGRLLAPFVGSTLESYTGIIGVVLLGIAVGNWLGGQIADRRPPVPSLVVALSVAGFLAMLSPWFVAQASGIETRLTARIVLLAAVGFFAPAAVLSMTTPLLARDQLVAPARAGRLIGGLSSAGTAGALMGSFVTGFYLLGRFRTTSILTVTGGALVAVAVAVVLFHRLAKRRELGLILAAVAVAGAVLVPRVSTVNVGCPLATAYYCVSVESDPARGTGRELVLDDNTHHSYIDLQDEAYLGYPYASTVAEIIEENFVLRSATLRSLTIGGGAFTLPRYLRATRERSVNDVLELDKGLVDIGEAQLGLVLDDRVRAFVGDARLTIRQRPPASYDVAIGDAFRGRSAPWHLLTIEFTNDVHRVLKPGGLYIVNLIDQQPYRFARAVQATLDARFRHVRVIMPTEGFTEGFDRNVLLVASDESIAEPLSDVADVTTVWRDLERGQVLRDDFAPVDQLLLADRQ